MTPHEYTVIGHRRSDVGRWLGLASVMLAPLLTHLAATSSTLPFLANALQNKLAAFTVSAGVVYAVSYGIFNRYAWRWFDKLVGVPNLSGRWQVHGETVDANGKTIGTWDRLLTVTQQWDRIAIEMNTGQSSSYSEMASLLVKHDGEVKLSYSYQNHPRPGEPDLQKHQGFCELIFDATRATAQGHYFNSLGRYTFGRLTLTKIKL